VIFKIRISDGLGKFQIRSYSPAHVLTCYQWPNGKALLSGRAFNGFVNGKDCGFESRLGRYYF
jgi:hypothetical protein